MRDDGCSLIFEYLSSSSVVPVVVAVEEVLGGDVPDGLKYFSGMRSVYRFDDHDSFPSYYKHGEIEITAKTIDIISYLIGLQCECWKNLYEQETSTSQQHL